MNIIKTNVNQEDKRAVYFMTMAPGRGRFADLKEQDVEVCDWVIYEGTNQKGEMQTMLSITDGAGKVYTTISASTIREFEQIIDLFDAPVKIHIMAGLAKSGREFITCTLAME